MLLQPGDYADFLLIHDEIGSNKSSVFYRTDNSTFFFIWLVSRSENIAMFSGNLVTQPGSFSSDFPNAIQITNSLSLSV